MAKRKMTPTPADNIAKQITEAYHPQDAQDIQDVVKRIFTRIFEAALKGEMQNHLGYASHARTDSSDNARNGYSEKTLKTTLGEIPIHVPRDRQGSFEPQIVKKHQRDVSSIEGKILALYGRGMSQRDIASTVEDIYGFKVSHEQISHITDCILEEVHDWQRRPLKPFYPFVFVDCLYVSLRTERGVQQSAVHVILAYDTEGCKDVLGLWINEVESTHAWMQLFDEIKARGVKEIGFLSLDGVTGLKTAPKPSSRKWSCSGASCISSATSFAISHAMNVKQARDDSSSSAKIWQDIPALWRYGRTILRMLNSCSLTAVPCARSCIRRTRSRA